ncbi:MAG: galactosyltransferase-related protein, partial [Desulfobacterales bacterium]|nr:galactosyltransferase-related protein [Desulfobacterales bacterium]
GKRVLVEKKLERDFNFSHTQSILKLAFNTVKGNISNAHHLIRIPFFPALTTTRMSGIRSCNMGFFRKDLSAVNGFNQAFQGWGREDSELAARLYNYGLKRREHPFMAMCFHLWHQDNDRTNLEKNDQLLEDVQRSGNYRCSNGLVDDRIGGK